mgnify:CR=1 FL=1
MFLFVIDSSHKKHTVIGLGFGKKQNRKPHSVLFKQIVAKRNRPANNILSHFTISFLFHDIYLVIAKFFGIRPKQPTTNNKEKYYANR